MPPQNERFTEVAQSLRQLAPARLLGRGTSPDEADQRIAAQGDLLDQLRPYATRILDTTGQPVDTRRRVEDALAAALLKHGKRIAAGT